MRKLHNRPSGMWSGQVDGLGPEDMLQSQATKPSLLIVTLPKSGTVYLNATFQRSLNLQDIRLCNGYFPTDHLSLDRLQLFVSDGGYIASTHLDPSPANLQLLDALLPRWVVHVRDPRASLLSWVHHVRRYHQESRGIDLLRVTPVPPDKILTSNLEECIDWHIDRYLRPAIDWIGAWIDVVDRRTDGQILLTEFSALRSKEEELCRKIASFIGFDTSAYQHSPPEKTMAAHYRVGELNEWENAFTRQQIERTASMIPQRLLGRFGWKSTHKGY